MFLVLSSNQLQRFVANTNGSDLGNNTRTSFNYCTRIFFPFSSKILVIRFFYQLTQT
jgi:hypothetical protein